ncbi:hypothetical protein GQ44DRAFT_628654, partial [Phaeosphaeriaceae sp. PMI808]
DFHKAINPKLGLIPTRTYNKPITFKRFIVFITPFIDLLDNCVSLQYYYRELRLTRLN